MILQSLINLLLAHDPLRVAVAGRIFPNRAPQPLGGPPTYPLVVLRRSSSDTNYHLLGEANSTHTLVQVDSYARTYTEAAKVAKLVADVLSGYKDLSQPVPFTLRGVFLENEVDLFESPAHGDEAGTHRVSQDFRVHFSE